MNNFTEIEEKWQKIWEETKQFKTYDNKNLPKYYALMMFPYPSGKLHMGHVKNYVIGDVVARYKIMQGFNVLHPMGWDAFGLPAENAAIKNKTHPKIWTEQNIKIMKQQLRKLGIAYDWDREITTCTENYYKWTQWFFLKFYEQGLAYKKKSEVNFCPKCNTVLANEQVKDGKCWRCDTEVQEKELEQWFFKITDYAEPLLNDLNNLPNWPDRVKIMQKNWIGKSEGVEIYFKLKDLDEIISVFTTRVDTIFGATYLTLAPEHPLIEKLIVNSKNKKEIIEFIEKVKKETKLQRTSLIKEGIFTGFYAINPVNNEELSIWIANYVLMEYGTGAIMAVPTHDERDFQFAKKYNLPLKIVIQNKNKSLTLETIKNAYEDEGILVNSFIFDGLLNTEAISKIADWMETKKIGKRKIYYRLKDWLISRQRYWGAPIPIIYCNKCGIVPAKQLPVLLPEEANFESTGSLCSLEKMEKFIKTTCPVCGNEAKRETDTMDTFVCSSWYYLRFADPYCDNSPFEKDKIDYWLPVDQYIGGIEHAVMHLLYARFFTKVLFDLNLVKFKEPFISLFTQGMVLKDGAVMSKSRGNVVSADEVIDKFSVDTARLFILFAAPPEKELEWNEQGVEGIFRFLNRVYRLIDNNLKMIESVKIESVQIESIQSNTSQKLLRLIHSTIKKITKDIEERFHFNTAISTLMEFINELYLYIGEKKDFKNEEKILLKQAFETVIILLAPFAPHLGEELWTKMGNKTSIFKEKWLSYNENFIKEETIELVIQINGKVRSKINIFASSSDEEIKNIALENEKVKNYIKGKEIKKIIIVQKKIVSIAV